MADPSRLQRKGAQAPLSAQPSVRRVARSDLTVATPSSEGVSYDFSRVPATSQTPAIQRDQDWRGRETTRRRDSGRDRVERRTDGSGNFSNDWAGRAILERYLTGGGDWDIRDDPSWSAYMKANASLRQQMVGRVAAIAQRIHGSGGTNPVAVNERFHVDIENGEGIVGYQYLHGTNANVGDFQITGSGQRTGANGVRLSLVFTWHDVIDPNPEYATDIWKSMFAEVITLGMASAYNIHIAWSSNITATIGGGNVSLSGWPGSG